MPDRKYKFSKGALPLSSESGNRRAVVDALILCSIVISAWFAIERTDICTRFFAYVAAHPDQELDSIILAGIFSTAGLLLFALRRWAEAARAEKLATTLASDDPLTGLPNRRSFTTALMRAVRKGGSPFCCLLVDLDNFKQVNDWLGHVAGDEVLKKAGLRLLEFAESDIFVARVGGDEFALLVKEDGADRASQLAALITERLREPVLINHRAVQTGASVGFARFPRDSDNAEALFRKADIALYYAKASGRNGVQRFTPEMEQIELRRAEIADALRQAIPKGEIVPHYQPLVELRSQTVIGYEVLARWHSPTLGVVGPDEFIPIAMDADLISALSHSLLQRACADALTWSRPSRISFNVAPRQLSDPALPKLILTILSGVGLPPHRLELELTEDALLTNNHTALANLAALKKSGITLALDDFGTGYSSLHHLRTLSFDKVKIDRSYIGSIATSKKSRDMVAAIIEFTHSLGIPVLAEGVETEKQAQFLRERGCDYAQGWLYGKPDPAGASLECPAA